VTPSLLLIATARIFGGVAIGPRGGGVAGVTSQHIDTISIIV